MSEKELETLRRKYSVARHQISLLYKDYLEEANVWKKENEAPVCSVQNDGELSGLGMRSSQQLGGLVVAQSAMGPCILTASRSESCRMVLAGG